MTREELIEVMARAICAGQGLYWEDQFSIRSSNGDPLAHEAFQHDAAALLAIEASGAVVVPSKTVEIALSLIEEIELDEDVSAVSYYARTLKLMLSASPYAPPGG